MKGKKEPARAYSLTSSPDEKYLAITVKEERYISGITPYPPLLSPILARRSYKGQKMVITGFTGPYTFSDKLRNNSEEAVHICAGSGIVPSHSIIKHDLRVNKNHKHTLIYSNKGFKDIIFLNQLNELEDQFPNGLNVVHTLTRKTNQSVFSEKVRPGRVTKNLMTEFVKNPVGSAVFTSGPDHTIHQKKAAKERGGTLKPSFMSSVLAHLDEIGVPKQNIKKESYG